MAKILPIDGFAKFLYKQYSEKAGYIMGSFGQDPKKWGVNSWWFTQYTGAQRAKALYWRAHAKRVFDCQGLVEGYYLDMTGVNVDTKARYNYANWCGIKGSGMIPADRRVPGAAVFWGTSAATIHHVGYLYKPVSANKPAGDWYIIEARGVNYGVVMTRLNSRKPNYWGWMTKYFDYTGSTSVVTPTRALGERELKKGMKGDDVVELQTILISLGFDLPKYGADGEYGSETEKSVKYFQKAYGLEQTGIADKATLAKIKTIVQTIVVTGLLVNIRAEANTKSKILGVAKKGETFKFMNEKIANDNGWYKISYKEGTGWISAKYSEPK